MTERIEFKKIVNRRLTPIEIDNEMVQCSREKIMFLNRRSTYECNVMNKLVNIKNIFSFCMMLIWFLTVFTFLVSQIND